jgi:hypothetical protein
VFRRMRCVVVIWLLAGCGGGGSGVDGSKALAMVSADEQAKICDWIASTVGGYDPGWSCAMSSYQPYGSRATCVALFPSTCAATVGQFESCSVAALHAAKTCTAEAVNAAMQRADCMALTNCPAP